MNLAIFTYSGVSLFELGCAVELFALPRPELSHWYHTQVITFEKQTLETTGGISMQCKHVDSLDDFDVLIIPSWPVERRQIPLAFADAIQHFFKRGGRVVSFCSGVFLIAELGLMRGREAITHWRYAETFKKRFPETHYQDDVLYCYDGKIGCSAGSSSGLDLGIEMIRQDFGHQVANKVARRLVMAAHRSGGQSQFVEKPVNYRVNHFAKTLDWAVKNLTAELSVTRLAEQANMSRRTFDRHFRQHLGMSPKQWLIDRRLDMAKQLLESTSENIEQIALKAGFDNAITLRHHFQKRLSLSPSRYREQFSS